MNWPGFWKYFGIAAATDVAASLLWWFVSPFAAICVFLAGLVWFVMTYIGDWGDDFWEWSFSDPTWLRNPHLALKALSCVAGWACANALWVAGIWLVVWSA